MTDVDDWNRWLDQHGRTLLLLARQWTASSDQAGDAMQEAFVRFWARRKSALDPTAYLYACLKRAAMDQHRQLHRRRRRERAVAREESVDHWLAVSDAVDPRIGEIEAALRELPEDQREVLTMKIWGRLTFEQIGAALEISPSTAASRYRYALEKLRVMLGAKEGVS